MEELKSILDLKNPIDIVKDNKNSNKDEKEDKKALSEITKDYVFTVDNFIKMCLILIRIRANIPVIMMGETGCGKTSLIRKLSELQNNGECNLIIDNIHAGHTNEDIIKFIEEKVIPEAKILEEKEKLEKIKYEVNQQIYEEKKLWVFFDELNTCKSMDLLSEIICKHSYEGKALPENVVFIGACNPYRKAKLKRAGLRINNASDNYEESDLVYTVNPMPHSLLNYVFDFGNLEPQDEKSYIISMVKKTIHEEKLWKLASELISTAQNFIRINNGVSSVSLREIRRFIIFYEFFLDYLKKKKETYIERNLPEDNNNKIHYSTLTDKEIKLYSINLSVYLGYYLRLNEDVNNNSDDNQKGKGLRRILYEKLNEIFMQESQKDFLLVPELEENFIADNVELEKGIAKNRALLENLFSLFVAINTKVPIFILGKPGCSKSLSVQLINNSMKGVSSSNLFFKKYPKMYVSTYQGSLNSTSEGVKAIFDKAREILKVSENKEKISTIYFDEMGLAEHSPHNPLKVIHSELEYDLNKDDKKVSFLGVSNWSLDSSKMNRGMTINIPEPNENDIITTSITISKSYLGDNIENNLENIFKNLGSSYYKYKQEFKNNSSIKNYSDFHGNRDFYHLIKYPSTKIKELLDNKKSIEKEFLTDIELKSMGRNFGGLITYEYKYKTGFNIICQKLSEYNDEIKNINDKNLDVDVKEKIINNLTEPTIDYLSRYLLLITKSNIGIYLLNSFLKSIKYDNNYAIFIGSIFLDDIQKEEYSSKILSKIKMNMEKDTILILKDMESIYPSLYDLFNQNFVKVKGKKYARIALGSKTNSFSEVNDKFRCIIIVDEDKLPDQEIPFLNRFEKQSLSFEYLMAKEQINIAHNLYIKCQNMIQYDENKFGLINYKINNLLINCDEEEIKGIVFMDGQNITDNNNNNEELFENILISKISVTLPQDIILLLLFNNLKEEKDEFVKFNNKIIKVYNQNLHYNIKSFLTNYKDDSNKIIIYTFTRIIDSIKKDYISSIKIKSIDITLNNIKEIRISSIINEFKLETEIEEFLDNDDLKIFFIKLLPFEYSTIDYLKVIIENKEKEYKNKKQDISKKYFIFLVHLKRINKYDIGDTKKMLNGTLSNLAGYSQAFIDDINGQDYFDDNSIISLDKMMKKKNEDLYKIFINLETIFLDNLNSYLCFFDYAFNLEEKILNKEKYINDLIELFGKDNHLIKIINELIIKLIHSKNEERMNKSLLEQIIQEEKFTKGDICIIDIVKKVIIKNYINEFKIIYRELEKINYFSSILNNSKRYIDNKANINQKEEFNQKIKEIFIENINLKNNLPEDEIKLDIFIGFIMPSKILLEEIDGYITNNIKNQYREIEDQYKNSCFEDEEIEEGKQQYLNKISLLNKDVQEFLIKNKAIKKIESEFNKGDKDQFYKFLLSDYLIFLIYKYLKDEKIISIMDIKLFIQIILELKFESNTNNIDFQKLCVEINWIGTYISEIISIIKVYIFLNNFDNDNLIEKIKNKFEDLNSEFESLEVNENMKLINKVFFIIIGSLVKVYISNINNFLSTIEDQNKFNIQKDNISNIYNSLLLINNNLNLCSKEIYLLHQTIKIISLLSFSSEENDFEKDKKITIQFINKRIINKTKASQNKKNEGPKLKKEEDNNNNEEDIDSEDEKALKENLNNFYNYYHEKKNLDFAKAFSSVLYDEFNKEYNEKYRKYLIETILKDDNLIQENSLLIKMIFADYVKPEQEFINDALDYISSEEMYFPIINKDKREIVEKKIMEIFDLTLNLYYESLDNIEEYIINDLFEIFKEYLIILNDEKYPKYYNKFCNENLVKLYTLCFIKIYLKKFMFYFCNNKNYLGGNEKKIIELICSNSPISNTIQIYFIYLLYNEKKSLCMLNEEKILSQIQEFANNLKQELSENIFQKNLEKLLIPKEEKYMFLEYFSYVEYPSFQDFKSKFELSPNNKEKYPLLNQYIKNEIGPKNLKYLQEYNDFINSMINYYSGKISRNEANKEERSLISEEIYKKDNNFKNKYNKFKSIYNDCLSEELKKYNENNLKSDKFIEKINGNERLAYYLCDNVDKEYGIFTLIGLKKFIEWQNTFLKPIIEVYKKKENNILNCYISKMEKTVNVQDVNNLQILNIDNCFDNTPFINFNELLYIYAERNKDDLNDFIYNYEIIEEELGKYLLPNKCLLNEQNFKYIIYQNEGFRLISYDFFIIFGKKYGEKELNEEEEKRIFTYVQKEYNSLDIFYESFILLINRLNNDFTEKKDTKVIDFINKTKKKYLNLSELFITFFNNEGKEITLEKLLNSFLYIEILCFQHLKDKIDNKFKVPLDKGQKEEIVNYFESFSEEILTKEEISSAVRKFITRYLLNESKKEKIDPNLKLYICLERKYLWRNQIFSKISEKNDFNNLIKKYMDNFSFSLEVKHCIEFYNIIGEKEIKFISEQKDKYIEKFEKKENNIILKTANKKSVVGVRAGGKKIKIVKGGNMKKE